MINQVSEINLVHRVGATYKPATLTFWWRGSVGFYCDVHGLDEESVAIFMDLISDAVIDGAVRVTITYKPIDHIYELVITAAEDVSYNS